MDDVTRDPRDEAMPYGVDTIRLRISFPAAPVSRGYNGRTWGMRPLRGWTGGARWDERATAKAEQGEDGAPGSAGWGGAGGGVAIPISDRIPAASDEPAMPGNPNAKVEALWAERAAVTAEMERLDAGGDHGRAAAELYQRLENRRDIIDADLRSQFNSRLSGTGLQEPGNLEAWLREQAEKAAGQPGAYDRMSAEEQRLFIRQHAPDYEIARADETARRYGEAVGGPVGRALEEFGSGIPGVAGGVAGMVGRRGGRGFRGGAGAPAETYPDGLAYRSDLPSHLKGPDGVKGSALNGTHNQNNAIAELQRRGNTYKLTPTSTPGINELNYQAVDPITGRIKSFSKMIYDPSVYSDQQMLDMALRAGKRSFELYKSDPTQRVINLNEGGVNFRSYINIDQTTGLPYVGNVHPIP